jgi:hypothetical protein
MRLRPSAPVLALAILLAARSACPAAPLIEPGEWEFTSTSESPSLPEPVVQTVRRCIEEAEFDPLRLVVQNHGCKITHLRIAGQVLRWQMECPNGFGLDPFHGEGELTSHGDRLEGNVTMQARLGEATVEVDTRWQGRLVGDCALE